ncbi:MAG: hypothetical protein IPM91_04550 [Bacteroidetes bacterium]|nr:hypothetical protein [Bacteroidota bacterium]
MMKFAQNHHALIIEECGSYTVACSVSGVIHARLTINDHVWKFKLAGKFYNYLSEYKCRNVCAFALRYIRFN